MINEDIRHRVEAELREGEELLWAEKISEKSLEKFIAFHSEDFAAYRKLQIFIIIVVVMSAIFVPSYRIYILALAFFIFGALLLSSRNSKATILNLKNNDIGGYALTNRRYIQLDKKFEVSKQKDASNLKKVVESTHTVNLRPIGRGILTEEHIYFLANNYATTNYIKSKIGTPL